MVGDVNLFFHSPDEPEVPEIEVMIAEKSSRRKGLAQEAVLCMMEYAVRALNTPKFVAKILDHNLPSIRLFEKMGFVRCGHSDVFQHTEMEFVLTETNKRILASKTQNIVIDDYEQVLKRSSGS